MALDATAALIERSQIRGLWTGKRRISLRAMRATAQHRFPTAPARRLSVLWTGCREALRISGALLLPIRVHEGDLPDLSRYSGSVAVDTEAMGLNPHRDRLCVVQISPGDGSVDVVRIARGQTQAPRMQQLLEDASVTKIFHYARFDVALLRQALGIAVTPVWCTKIASRLARTYTDRHGLKDLTREVLGMEVSKQQQSSDWGAPVLSEAQVEYAASDVLHLHALKDALEARLRREERLDLAEACFRFLPYRSALDLLGWADEDIFAHS
jgi:ribonuclease D